MSGTIHIRPPYALKECTGTVFYYGEADALKITTSFWTAKKSYVVFLQSKRHVSFRKRPEQFWRMI